MGKVARILIKCSKCKQEKLPECFPKGNKKNGYGGWCKDCEHKRSKIYRENNPEYSKSRCKIYQKANKDKIKNHNLLKDYGITLDDFNKMLTEQGNKCKVCGKELTRPCIDHNHKTNRVRGVLCQKCNAFLGLVEEDLKIISKAIEYLLEDHYGITKK